MESLSAVSLPPGFGFHPTDVELISHYLQRKIRGQKIDFEIIPEVDIYKHEPWDLPAKCHVPTRDSKWHFFASRDKKYPNSSRSNRATGAGYWKSTGKDRNIRNQNRVIGTKKTLVFHEGRPPCGKRTDWIMHEYYINESECKAAPGMKDAYVLCRVTKRNGLTLEGENVSPETEDTDYCLKQPQDVVASIAPEKSSSPSESVEDFEAWFSELLDPNFSTVPTFPDVKSEPTEGLSSLAPNHEHFLPEASEDSHLLFPVEDFYSILQSDYQNFDAFGELDMGTFDTLGDHQGDIFAGMNNDEFCVNDDNSFTGIQLRERAVKHSPGMNQRIKIQVSKMESRTGESLCRTVKIEQGVHLDTYIEKQHIVEFKSPKTARKYGGMSCLRGFMRRLGGFFGRCSPSGINFFFLGAFLMGTAALICYL